MRRISERWLVVALIFVTGAYAVAEDITLTTYYPSPRGVYQEVRWGTNAAASLNADQGASIELRGTGTPYLDFSNDAVIDFDVRMILANDDTLNVDGGNLAVTGGNLSASGTVSAPTVTGNTSLCIGADCRTAWPVSVGDLTISFSWWPDFTGAGTKTISQLQWHQCLFENDPSIPFSNFSKITGAGTCHARRFNVPGTCPPAGSGCVTRWWVMAACPTGWKAISGGAWDYPVWNDERPGNVYATNPTTYGEFAFISAVDPVSVFRDSGPAGANDEGWETAAANTGGYDGIRLQVLCAGP